MCTIIGECGTGKSTFGVQFLTVGASAQPSERGVYLCGDEGEAALHTDFNHLGLKQMVQDGSIRILDVAKTRLAYGSSTSSPAELF